MAAVVPLAVNKNDIPFQNAYGTDRRFCEIIVEVSATAADTTNLATYVPNLGGIISLTPMSNATSVIQSNLSSHATWSGTTVTWLQTGTVQNARFLGYYT